jgi:two-component SAPR family response regulator
VADRVQTLLRLYLGPFLPDQDQPWLFATRERLRSKFIRAVGVLGGLLQQAERWGEVTLLYRRAIELEPLAEDFYRAHMQGLIAQGRNTEAKVAYFHCEQTFARLLGTKPSAVTCALFASLR